MTWLEHHKISEELAARAELAARKGHTNHAKELYARAARAEEQALEYLDSSKTRTRGISAVSAVSLFLKASELVSAETLAYRWLANGRVPEFASEQLRALLQSIWSEQVRERAGVGFAPGQVLVSVKGGEIVEGGAPLDLIVEKVQTVQSLFYRTTELLRGLPHRKRGSPPKDIVDSCRPWLFQTAPGSYQFAVAVQEQKQREMFGADEPRPEVIADRFLSILRASAVAPDDELPELVTDPAYRSTFLQLTRNLAPTGKRFGELEVRSASETQSVNLIPSTRVAINDAIRAVRKTTATKEEVEEEVYGILRAVHLDQDWIEVAVEKEHVRINQVGEAVDDVIGPMVNHPVRVQVVRGKQGKVQFRDIELDD